MTKRLTKADKLQLQARHIFWAFDYERKAREKLDRSGDLSLTADRDAAFAEYKQYVKWRDDELVKATGMNFRQLHDMAFKANGRLA